MSRSSLTVAIAGVVLVCLSAFALAAPQANLKSPAALKEQAPATYNALFQTTAGNFVIEVHRDWAPVGADRFYNAVKNGFYDGCRFFRVVPDLLVQFGINSPPAVPPHQANA